MSLLALILAQASASHDQDSGDLAKAAQNPVAAMISLPLQNNTFFGVGPDWSLRFQLQFLFPK
jgi:hypothetical protein